MNRHFHAEVAENTHLSDTHNILKVQPKEKFSEPGPGQFYLLKVSNVLDPLLRRPFSILRWDDKSLEFLIMLRGRGTSLIRNMNPGECIDLIGPLGRGFEMPSAEETPLVIAGGVGVASIYPLIERLGEKAHIFYGAARSNGLYLLEDLERLTDNIHLSTDDGSRGFSGNSVSNLSCFLESSNIAAPVIYACGPEGMMEALIQVMREKGLKGSLSLEERMACGVGACLGCAMKTEDGYKCVCREGPVFSIDERV